VLDCSDYGDVDGDGDGDEADVDAKEVDLESRISGE
jgi:hypothetical protein